MFVAHLLDIGGLRVSHNSLSAIHSTAVCVRPISSLFNKQAFVISVGASGENRFFLPRVFNTFKRQFSRLRIHHNFL